MFEHNNRQSLLDAVRPPAGYHLENALGTTYSLDMVTLTGMMLAFIDAELDSQHQDVSIADSLSAMIRLTDRIRIFVNRGNILGSLRKSNKVCALYDQIVREVQLDEVDKQVRSFHPKVWILYYTPIQQDDGTREEPIIRVLCMSRNATTSQTWEICASLQGTAGNQKTQLGIQISEFARHVLQIEDRPDPQSPRLLKPLLDGLIRTEFELPASVTDDFQFLWKAPASAHKAFSLPSHGKRALIVSPFVRAEFLQDVVPRFQELTLVTEERELDQLDDRTFELLMERKCALYTICRDQTGETDLSLGLHAKIYIFEQDGHSFIQFGSANATRNGWYANNAEAMISFGSKIGVSDFNAQFIHSRDKEGEASLRGWIEEYTRETREKSDEEKDELQQEIETKASLDLIQRLIAALKLTVTYDNDRQQLILRAAPNTQLQTKIGDWTKNGKIAIHPLSLKLDQARQLDDSALFENGIRFAAGNIGDLTEFFHFELSLKGHRQKRSFVLKADGDLKRLHKDRNAALLKKLVKGDMLQLLLRNILFEGFQRSQTDMTNILTGKQPELHKAIAGNGFTASTTIEDILKACTEDPRKIRNVRSLLDSIEGTDLLDSDFFSFWKEFEQAASKESTR